MNRGIKSFLIISAVAIVVLTSISLMIGCSDVNSDAANGENESGTIEGPYNESENTADPATEAEQGSDSESEDKAQVETETEPKAEPETEPEVDEPETVQGIVTAAELYVRSGPDAGSSKLGTLSKGTSVTIFGTYSGWHQIEYGSAYAYVSADHIELKYTVDPSEHVISNLAKNDLFPIAESYSFAREFAPEYILLHFSSAVLIDPNDPYNMDLVRDIFIKNGVCANYIIDRDGTIYCNVPEDRAAYHAGAGSYGGIDKLTNSMNRYSIGIEILAIGSVNDMSVYMSASEYAELDTSLIGYTDAQYESVKALVADICQRNGIPADRSHVIGHEEYKPGKNDPGELFDWERLFLAS